jgi:cell division protein FtsI/penicillin-binding protein 2
MAAALDAGVVQPNDIFIDTGSIEVGGHTIRNWDYSAWGAQTMIGCLRYSLNVCLAYVASDKLKAAPFYNYLTEFGVGQLTGIDLAGEVAGQLRTPRHPEWTESDLGTNSFGQGVSVTPIQLLTAVAAIANGGVMVQPHVVREIVSAEGVYHPRTTVLGQPVSAAAAQTLTSMLVESLQGETRRAAVTGYVLAGKTGTAQIPTDKGYDPKWTIASFVGWGPVTDPRFVVLVRLDKPETSPWGSVVAAPVFQEIVERLVVLLQIPPADVQALAAGG